MMVRDFQSVVGIEAREQFIDMTGHLPTSIVACVGGGLLIARGLQISGLDKRL